MRITKKFAGASCIGKQVFQPSEGLLADRSEEIQELEVLETLFYHRVGDRSGGGQYVLHLPYFDHLVPKDALTNRISCTLLYRTFDTITFLRSRSAYEISVDFLSQLQECCRLSTTTQLQTIGVEYFV